MDHMWDLFWESLLSGKPRFKYHSHSKLGVFWNSILPETKE